MAADSTMVDDLEKAFGCSAETFRYGDFYADSVLPGTEDSLIRLAM